MQDPSELQNSAHEGEVREFVEHLSLEKHYAKHTVTAYRSDLRQVSSFLQRHDWGRPLSETGKPELRLWFRELSESVGPATLARKVATLRAFFSFFQEVGKISENPANGMRLPRVRRKDPIIVSAEAASELMNAPSPDDDPFGRRDRAVLELLYGSGLRVSEVTSLDVASIDLQSAHAHVTGKGKKQRIVPLGKQARDALHAYLPMRATFRNAKTSYLHEEALFLGARGGRLGVRRVQELVKRYGALATGRSGLHPHALRHACATHMLEGGADLRAIQDLLGHETVATTQRYTHLTAKKLTEIYDRAHPLARSTGSHASQEEES